MHCPTRLGASCLFLILASAQACRSEATGPRYVPPPVGQPPGAAASSTPPPAEAGHADATPVTGQPGEAPAAQPPVAAPAPASPIVWELEGNPAVLSMARRSSFQLIVSATNRGTERATPQLYRGELTVNGQPSMSFGLAFGNGVMESGWSGLEPGQHVETRRDLGESLFPAPGDYLLVFTNGDSRSTVKVRVTP